MNSISEYIKTSPQNIQMLLEQMYAIIKQKAPQAKESISYGMPTFKMNGKPLVYFAGFKNHIGFYATPTGHKEFAAELSSFKQGKGSVQFPLNKPIPFDLIGRMVEYRVKENSARSK
jgi:uncharacterized protein YdhG (YjbR/CyaY superfamily)